MPFYFLQELISQNNDLAPGYAQYPVSTPFVRIGHLQNNGGSAQGARKKPKQVKKPWTTEEEKKFFEAYEEIGEWDAKKIAEKINTRSIV